MFLTPPVDRYLESYADFCAELKSPISDSHAPCSTFWLIDKNEVVGVGNVRYCLAPELEFFGGHIVYAVKTSRRGNGLGTMLLGELLKQAQSFGIKTALLTCLDTNTASQRVIEKNGGIWLDTIVLEISNEKRLGRRYLVDTGLAYSAGLLVENHVMIFKAEGSRRLMLTPRNAIAEGGQVVSYYFNILSMGDNVGWIVFRVANNEESLYYDGNIGYYINKGRRGYGFAEAACRLIGDKLKRLSIPRVVITCDMDNTPSRRVCQKLGAAFLEIAVRLDQTEKRIKCRYVWEI